jgi:hypothetical protein
MNETGIDVWEGWVRKAKQERKKNAPSMCACSPVHSDTGNLLVVSIWLTVSAAFPTATTLLQVPHHTVRALPPSGRTFFVQKSMCLTLPPPVGFVQMLPHPEEPPGLLQKQWSSFSSFFLHGTCHPRHCMLTPSYSSVTSLTCFK